MAAGRGITPSTTERQKVDLDDGWKRHGFSQAKRSVEVAAIRLGPAMVALVALTACGFGLAVVFEHLFVWGHKIERAVGCGL